MDLTDIKVGQTVIEDKPIHSVYIDYQMKAEELFGEKTIVLMQLGDFIEIYGYELPEFTQIDHLRNLLTILNCAETSKNKSIPHSLKNPKMCGFPLGNLDRRIELLINNGYTIVNISQIGNSVEFNKNKLRKVVSIISPSTYINSSSNSNILLSIYLSEYKNKLYSSLSYCDVIQGNNTIYDITDDENSEDIIYKMIRILEPKEIILINNVRNIDINKLLLDLEIVNYKYKIIDYDVKFNNINFQEHVLTEIFRNDTSLNIFEYLNIELLSDSRITYIYLLNFLQEHDCNILNNIDTPTIYKSSDFINLDRDTIYRLNLLYNDNNDTKYSLLNILNKTVTNIGKRKFRGNLLQPIIDRTELLRRYTLIDYFINNHDMIVTKYLANIHDIPKLHRKIHITNITNNDLNKLYISYINILQLIKTVDILKFNMNDDEYNILNNLIEYISININIHELNIGINFNPGVHIDLDELLIKINEYTDLYSTIQLELSKYIETEANCSRKTQKLVDDNITISVNLEYKNHQKILYLTEPKAKLLELYIKKHKTGTMNNFKLSDIKIMQSAKKNRYNIIITNLDNVNEKLNELHDDYNNLFTKYYDEFMKNMYATYIINLHNLIQFIEDVDISYCNANNAKRYNYRCPNIMNNCKSYFNAKAVRHPIIEQIHTDIPYISNDLGLGNNKDGLLIYGINSSGKSSLMKSIGLCIIMAQSGMYVPAKEFEYSPYKSIFTRIGIQDNIFTGRSSFTQEMYELRNIFNNADENSLIIGDEICNGTEECSALSLVASTIKILSEKKSTFIFATHLHRLVELDVINNIDNLLIKHLKITHKNGLLIYNRTLDEGNGSQEYGIMVAQTLNMPDEFIKYANNVRTIVKNEVNIFDAKSNRYNSAKFSTVCQICEENYNEIHHIKFQKDANQYKYVNDTYLNDKYNLVALCSQCHDKIHNDKIIINGFIETSQGVKLDYK
jgi:DNA mismatch repair protein MutS